MWAAAWAAYFLMWKKADTVVAVNICRYPVVNITGFAVAHAYRYVVSTHTAWQKHTSCGFRDPCMAADKRRRLSMYPESALS